MIPGLELHELDGETAFYLSKEAKTTDPPRTATELEEERAVEEELKEAKTEMKEAEKTLESEIATEEEVEDCRGKNLSNVSVAADACWTTTTTMERKKRRRCAIQTRRRTCTPTKMAKSCVDIDFKTHCSSTA